MNLTRLIAGSVRKAQKEKFLFEEVYSNFSVGIGKNEFLFFIKPEITSESKTIQLEKVLDLVQDQIDSFGLTIHNAIILSAKYLDDNNIMAQHYGVINKISASAVQNMSESAKNKFTDIYGKSVYELKVLGGSELLNEYKHFNAYTLDYLWQNKVNLKLAGGTYCEDIKIDDEIVYLINGFHPRQLKHFTEQGRSIVVMTLSGNISWTEARNNFIGSTNPNNALAGSLRREFLDRKSEFGLADVSQGSNGVHLSAGPVEALLELKRFTSVHNSDQEEKGFDDFQFGKGLKEAFNTGQIEKIVNNENLTVNGKVTSIFDLTEEMDSDQALEILKSYL